MCVCNRCIQGFDPKHLRNYSFKTNVGRRDAENMLEEDAVGYNKWSKCCDFLKNHPNVCNECSLGPPYHGKTFNVDFLSGTTMEETL